MKKITNKGFTLIELLVVVAIIAILALVVLLALNPAEMARRSRDSRRLSDLSTLRKAVDLSLADGNTLVSTGTPADWVTLVTGGAGTTGDVDNFAGMTGFKVGKYLSIVAQDPMTGLTGKTQNVDATTGTCVLTPDVNDSDMHYQFKSDGNVYELRAHMESDQNCAAVKDDGKKDAYYEMGTNPGMAW
jgi:prepilin-type N-terminal cleavage/methylation domain-containing protein